MKSAKQNLCHIIGSDGTVLLRAGSRVRRRFEFIGESVDRLTALRAWPGGRRLLPSRRQNAHDAADVLIIHRMCCGRWYCTAAPRTPGKARQIDVAQARQPPARLKTA